MNKDLTPNEIKTILSLSAQSDSGWTPRFGAGIVDAKRSLDYRNNACFEITHPEQHSTINISNKDTLSIRGSILTNLFNSYIVRIRSCREPSNCK